MNRSHAASSWHFDIDAHLNKFLPPSPLRRLPRAVSRLLGYRTAPPEPLGNIAIIFWSFVGVFCSLLLIEFVGRQVPAFKHRDAPPIIASFGAAAVLEFYAIESALAQPRNAILSQVVSSAIGVGIQKLFALSPHFADIRWFGGPLACAIATATMALLGVVHPPAGATALIAVLDDEAYALGWYLVPLMLLGCVLMLAVAMLVNNVQRRFPVYWWTPEEVGHWWKGNNSERNDLAKKRTGSESDAPSRDVEAHIEHLEASRRVVITRGTVIVPSGMYLRPEEVTFLETLSQRL